MRNSLDKAVNTDFGVREQVVREISSTCGFSTSTDDLANADDKMTDMLDYAHVSDC